MRRAGIQLLLTHGFCRGPCETASRSAKVVAQEWGGQGLARALVSPGSWVDLIVWNKPTSVPETRRCPSFWLVAILSGLKTDSGSIGFDFAGKSQLASCSPGAAVKLSLNKVSQPVENFGRCGSFAARTRIYEANRACLLLKGAPQNAGFPVGFPNRTQTDSESSKKTETSKLVAKECELCTPVRLLNPGSGTPSRF